MALAAAVLAWQRPWAGPASSADEDQQEVVIGSDARAVLGRQLADLSTATDRAAFAAAAGAGEQARRFADEAWSAREALGVQEVTLRYVEGGDRVERSDGSTLARVQVSWRVDDTSPIAGTAVRGALVGLRLEPRADGTFDVLGTESAGDPLPLWLAGDLRVSGDDRARAIVVDGGVPGVDTLALARRAADVARASLPGVDEPVTVVSAADRSLSAALIGRTEQQIAPIAGVTTTVDGTAETARVVVLNPDLFAAMDDRSRQVVVSHEAVHVLTDVVGTQMPPWVVEGFADYVALRDDDAPLSVSAGQVLRQVAAAGAPDELPGPAEFSAADGPGLSAVYESAWLVFRMLAEDVSHERLLAFHEAVRTGADTDAAAREHLGDDLAGITARWQDYLEKSASTVS